MSFNNNCREQFCNIPQNKCNKNFFCGDPYPLKSFCDPNLDNICEIRPIINKTNARPVTTWTVNYLVSNAKNLATTLDTNVINPWGIAIYDNKLWVVNNSTDTVTSYDIYGNKLETVSTRDGINNTSFPTGIAINCGDGFNITNGNSTRSGLFIVPSEQGSVHIYNPLVNPSSTYLAINHQNAGKIVQYTGVAVANSTLYLVDFFQSKIDVYDPTYNLLSGYRFIDNDSSDPIPLDYSPFNIVYIGCYLYVLWVKKDPYNTLTDLPGVGNGFISIFTLDGGFVRRFTSRGVLNSPWAMIPAPCECGILPGSFIVGNNGDGHINIFDHNGRYCGPLLAATGLPIKLPGLWGLVPHYADINQIFFASATDKNTDGFVGNIIKSQVIML